MRFGGLWRDNTHDLISLNNCPPVRMGYLCWQNWFPRSAKMEFFVSNDELGHF